MDALNAAYRRDDHQRVIALLGERLQDPAFTAGMQARQIAKLRLMAIAPFEALPCGVVPERATAALPATGGAATAPAPSLR